MLAERAGADAPEIVAALLHDIGHVFAAPAPAGFEAVYDDKHEVIGALWLEQCFVCAVSQPVRQHVAAKRYLVATRRDYDDRLAADSALSLKRQGGPMSDDEIDVFRSQPGWEAGVRLRVWDDEAKVWETTLPPLKHFARHLEAALRG
jgi:predicted HD phosphohydrolase